MPEFAVVVGGAGALGDALIAQFRQKYVYPRIKGLFTLPKTRVHR
jgi:hypothetical protein